MPRLLSARPTQSRQRKHLVGRARYLADAAACCPGPRLHTMRVALPGRRPHGLYSRCIRAHLRPIGVQLWPPPQRSASAAASGRIFGRLACSSGRRLGVQPRPPPPHPALAAYFRLRTQTGTPTPPRFPRKSSSFLVCSLTGQTGCCSTFLPKAVLDARNSARRILGIGSARLVLRSTGALESAVQDGFWEFT